MYVLFDDGLRATSQLINKIILFLFVPEIPDEWQMEWKGKLDLIRLKVTVAI